ncbi:hypothetical protein [Helicobacter pylori]|nr:hypothetical protein [Helicobacter pylori]
MFADKQTLTSEALASIQAVLHRALAQETTKTKTPKYVAHHARCF